MNNTDEDIEAILNDLNIDTSLKDEIDKIIFGDDSINKKRIRLRKLRAKGLDYKNLRLFLRLLEHIKQLWVIIIITLYFMKQYSIMPEKFVRFWIQILLSIAIKRIALEAKFKNKK